MPFWNPERQKRVARRLALLKEAIEIIISLLTIGGLIAGGVGLTFFILGIFMYWETAWAMGLMVLGFGAFMVGLILDAMIQGLTSNTSKAEVKK